MTKKYQYYVDARHGWIRVKREELQRLEIADKVSAYSYQMGEWVYLEEDRDGMMFDNAKKARGEAYETCEKYSERSCVRDKEKYKAA